MVSMVLEKFIQRFTKDIATEWGEYLINRRIYMKFTKMHGIGNDYVYVELLQGRQYLIRLRWQIRQRPPFRNRIRWSDPDQTV